MSNVIESDHDDNKFFFKAFSRLTKKYEHLFLLITGACENYKKLIEDEFEINGRIISMGWVEFELYNKYLSACDLFVLPYKNTNINAGRWPNKIGDYLCLARPVLTNPTGDIRQYIEKYRLGILCDDNPEGFYTAIDSILEDDTDLEGYSSDSLSFVEKKLSFDKRIDKMLNIFQSHVKK